MSASETFREAIDPRHDAGQSVVRRYRRVLAAREDGGEALAEALGRTSIREGVRVFPLLEHRGVAIDVLDESSRMHTQTLKSVDGAVTAAHCLLRGDRRVVFESGGNTATALTRYGTHAGIETFCFVPSKNLPLLDSGAFASDTAHLIAVDEAPLVKEVAHAFAERHGLPLVPERPWRYQSSMLIGSFVLEHALEHGGHDVLVQSISAAFGPIGIYRMLRSHGEAQRRLPRFLGVQQASNCPMVRAWRASSNLHVPRSDGELLAQVMYDREPERYGTFGELRGILVETGGDLTTVDHDDYRALLEIGGRSLIDRLADHGVRIGRRDGDVLEKAGLIALIGALREIEAGRIAAGSRVLVCLTGGAAQPDGRVVPDCRIAAEPDARALQALDALASRADLVQRQAAGAKA